MSGSDNGNDRTGRRRVPDQVVVDLVSDDRCRAVLTCLVAADGPVPVEDLARAVVARETGDRQGRDRAAGNEAIDESRVRDVRDSLFQRELPKLTPTGLVSYDSMVGTVALDTDDERVLASID